MTNVIDNLLKTYTFVCGSGTPGKSACWMTFFNVMLHGQWGAYPQSVNEPILRLCITINDTLPDADRMAVITEFGPRLPFGTAPCSAEVTKRRAYHLVTAAARVWAADAMKYVGLTNHAAALSALPAYSPSVRHLYRDAIYAARIAAHDSLHFAASAAAADIAAAAAANIAAADAAQAAECAGIAALSSRRASASASRYAALAAPSSTPYIRTRVLPVLRELIDMGPRCPVEPCCTPDRLAMIGATA